MVLKKKYLIGALIVLTTLFIIGIVMIFTSGVIGKYAGLLLYQTRVV